MRGRRPGQVKREYAETPLVGVGAVIVNRDRVLLVRRGTAPLKGRWTLPGGMLEVGETLAAGVVREVKEETGLDVEVVELVELLERIYRDGDQVQYHYVIADYLCHLTGGKLKAASDADAVCWAERAEWMAGGALEVDEVTARVVEAGWQRERDLQERREHP